jgi:hypothetical protein
MSEQNKSPVPGRHEPAALDLSWNVMARSVCGLLRVWFSLGWIFGTRNAQGSTVIWELECCLVGGNSATYRNHGNIFSQSMRLRDPENLTSTHGYTSTVTISAGKKP